MHNTDRPVIFTDMVESVNNRPITDMPVARWMYLGSVTCLIFH